MRASTGNFTVVATVLSILSSWTVGLDFDHCVRRSRAMSKKFQLSYTNSHVNSKAFQYIFNPFDNARYGTFNQRTLNRTV